MSNQLLKLWLLPLFCLACLRDAKAIGLPDPYNSSITGFEALNPGYYDSFYNNGVRTVFNGGGVVVPIYENSSNGQTRSDVQLPMHSPCAGGQSWNYVLARYEQCAPPTAFVPATPTNHDNVIDTVTVKLPPISTVGPEKPLAPYIPLAGLPPTNTPAAPVPEPSTLAMLGLVAAGRLLKRRTKN